MVLPRVARRLLDTTTDTALCATTHCLDYRAQCSLTNTQSAIGDATVEPAKREPSASLRMLLDKRAIYIHRAAWC